ncbi:MAG: SGNH/GDSL hydrolase family protein [Gemmatimonadales bacterium]|nr:MAG: SGNH/GDSL hydrolase family protein [Gemmatimonadales bacterium]
MKTPDPRFPESSRRPRVPGPLLLLVALLVPVLTASCADEVLAPGEAPADELFERYVALGNSITAGFQSEGINAQTQVEAYPVLLAEQMNTPFPIPTLTSPGCPPPVINGLTRERLGGAGAPQCSLRGLPAPERIHNLAVPGAATLDLLSNQGQGTNANELTTLILGGFTQIQLAEALEPTFASVWIGNNDVLGAALAGVATEATVTDPAELATNHAQVLDRLEDAGARGGVVIGVADVTLVPNLVPGAAFWAAEAEGALPGTFQVSDACAPEAAGGQGEAVLVPFAWGFGELLARAEAGQEATLDCTDETRVLVPEEVDFLQETVAAYNEALAADAQARGWAWFDPNPLFLELADQGLVPPFPMVSDPEALFGPLFSLDGVHPSGAAHRLVANGVVDAVNATYGTNLEPVEPPALP